MLWERSSEILSVCVCSIIAQCVRACRKHCSSFYFTDKYEINFSSSHGQGQTASHTSKVLPRCGSFHSVRVLVFGLGYLLFKTPFQCACVHVCVCFFEGINTPAPFLFRGRLLYGWGHQSCNITANFSTSSNLINCA